MQINTDAFSWKRSKDERRKLKTKNPLNFSKQLV